MIAHWLPQWREWFGGFAWPWAFALLPLPLLLRWILPAKKTASPALRVPFGERLQTVAASGNGLRAGGRNIALFLAAIAWVWLCVAAARPQQLGDAVAPPQSARSLMLAVDLSGSMGETDMELGGRPVDRLTAAKAVLADFLDRRAGDRVGLLVFGSRAYALAPLTFDRDSVRAQLRDSVVGLAGRETALGDAIGLAVKRLREQPPGQRVLVVLTDGVNTAGVLDPLKAAELARDEGVRVHTVGLGNGGGMLSVFGLPVGGDDDIDEDGLKKIAGMTGGHYFRARDTSGLAGIYAELDKIEPVRQEGKKVRPRIERYPLPLTVALVFALCAFAWPRARA